MVIDDEENMTKILSRILQGEGFLVKAFNNPVEAVGHIRQSPPDIVLTDLRMPPGDGLELIRQLRRSERANMPVIIMSGNAEVKDAIDGMHLSVLDFLLKPIDTEKLTALIKRELHIE